MTYWHWRRTWLGGLACGVGWHDDRRRDHYDAGRLVTTARCVCCGSVVW